MPPLNQSQPTASTICNQQDDTLSKKPAPKTVQYQPPTFNFDRPTVHHDINHIDVTPCHDEIEINEVHIWNPNYKGKNYDPYYQQKKKTQLQQ